MRLTYVKCITLALAGFAGMLGAAELSKYDYRLLATSKTSTAEKELNAAAADGYSFSSVMGGQTGVGGKEVVIVMAKKSDAPAGNKEYKLLATAKTSTLQMELQNAGNDGFDYCGQTVFQSAFGGKEVSVILERNPTSKKGRIEFKLLATIRTSTMEKELKEAGAAGYEFLGVMVGNMVGTSLAMAPSFVLGQLCDVVDLDGPTFLKHDPPPTITYSDGMIWCDETVWGSQSRQAA